MKTIIFPLTRDDDRILLHARRIVKKKMKKINVLLESGRYSIIEGVQKKGNNMNTYELNETNTMTEAEAAELFAWLAGEILRGE
jgi:hypothetical protein